MLLLELLVDELPTLRRHLGPPVWSRSNAEKFLKKYITEDVFAGPFIDEGRYVVEIERAYIRAIDLVQSRALFETALGKHVRDSMRSGMVINTGKKCWDEDFAAFLSDFLQRSSPLAHIGRRS